MHLLYCATVTASMNIPKESHSIRYTHQCSEEGAPGLFVGSETELGRRLVSHGAPIIIIMLFL